MRDGWEGENRRLLPLLWGHARGVKASPWPGAGVRAGREPRLRTLAGDPWPLPGPR